MPPVAGPAAASAASTPQAQHRRRTLSLPLPSGVYASLAGVSAVLSWEWIVSALNKLTNSVFVDQFGSYVRGQLHPALPGFYRTLLRLTAVDHARPFAWFSIGLELTLGVSLAAAAVVLLFRIPSLVRPTLWGVTAAGFGGALFALNLAVLNGDPAPWSISGAPFQSGIPVEYLLAMVSIAAGVGAAVLLRRTRYLIRRG